MPDANDTRRIFLGMPGYDGRVSMYAARALWRASRNMDPVWVQYQAGSLLATNFNHIWCTALNFAHRGENIAYFAMLHDDIGPEDFWLDTLIAEMVAKNLDVLGVVSPLKDTRGLTSTALAREDGDTWRPLCRLSMQEVYALPETFTGDDVGHPLLINTGCWVCRFDPEWARLVRFTVNDRIVFNTALDKYMAETEPEDWYFSRLLRELGLKIGVTRKIKLLHHGTMLFGNTHIWGQQQFDSEWLDRPVVEAAERSRFPHDVDGWLLPSEGEKLSSLAVGKRVLEIGSYCGRSTICLARSAASVVSVDPHDGRGTPNQRNTRNEFIANVTRYGVANRIRSCDSLADLNGSQFDLVFIDGSHDYASVQSDIEAAIDRLSPGGLVVFHDHNEIADVTLAVQRLCDAGGALLETHESLAVVRPPAATPLEV